MCYILNYYIVSEAVTKCSYMVLFGLQFEISDVDEIMQYQAGK